MSNFVDLLVTGSSYYFAGPDLFDDADLSVVGGDLAIVSGEDSLKKSIFRRLVTPTGIYQITVKTYEQNNIETGTSSVGAVQTVVNGDDYGSNIGLYLSEPITLNTVSLIKEDVIAYVSKDDRINLIDLELELSKEYGSIVIKINYEIVETGQTATATVEVNPTA